MTEFYQEIEEPLKDLVKLLRDNGFNTVCSCGHYPNPYIQLKWNNTQDIYNLHNLLVKNGYKKNTFIKSVWNIDKNEKHLQITFYIKMPLAKLKDIKCAGVKI